ncbi:MAG: phosphate ABC transporter permease PstA [Acidimicrobiales bacterium]
MTAIARTVAGRPSPAPPARRRDATGLVRGAAVAGLSFVVTAALFAITPLSGGFGFVACWYALFLAGVATDSTRVDGPLIARDKVATIVVTTAGLLTLLPLVLILGFVVTKGVGALRAGFFTHTLEAVGPLDPATAGGAQHAVLGTLQQVAIAAALSVPLGIATAVYLNEFGGRLAGVVRFFVDAMSGIPSIVAGLFVFAVWVLQLGRGFSGMAAGLALAVLMLPTVTRTAEEMLRLVPDGLREAALALGAPHWRTVMRVVLPSARSGLVTAVMLGVARVVGETAPLLLTAFGTDAVNTDPLHDPQSALPLFVYQQIRNPGASPIARAWTGALVLILVVLSLFIVARLIGGGTRRKRFAS